MADVDVVGSGVLSQNIASENRRNTQRSVAVTLAVVIANSERGRPAFVREQFVRCLIEIFVTSHLPPIASQAGTGHFSETTEELPALFQQLDGFLIKRHALHSRFRIDVD